MKQIKFLKSLGFRLYSAYGNAHNYRLDTLFGEEVVTLDMTEKVPVILKGYSNIGGLKTERTPEEVKQYLRDLKSKLKVK